MMMKRARQVVALKNEEKKKNKKYEPTAAGIAPRFKVADSHCKVQLRRGLAAGRVYNVILLLLYTCSAVLRRGRAGK